MRRMPQFLVWNPDHGFPTIAHATMADAVKESERLATANPGQRFYVMAPIGFSMIERPQIYRADDRWSELPF